MEQPTEEQIREFWEWCGFKHVPAKYCDACRRWQGEYWWKDGIGRRIYRPELLEVGLNRLGEYALPKVVERSPVQQVAIRLVITDNETYVCTLRQNKGIFADELIGVSGEEKTLALALFWAIWQVKERG